MSSPNALALPASDAGSGALAVHEADGAGPGPGEATASSPSWRQRLGAHLLRRLSVARRTLPRDLAIVLLIFLVSRHMSLAWIMTDSVHTSVAVVVKGGAPHRGDLAAFAYSGGTLKNYYLATPTTRAALKLGMNPVLDGPRKGDGFLKYLQGLPGDRIEVEDRKVFLVTPKGRFFMGEGKSHTRHGVPLEMIRPQTIPPGFVYVWAPHRDALDSRYSVMGLVPSTSIVGKGIALW